MTRATEAVGAAPIASTTRVFEAPIDALDIGHDFRIDDDPEALGELAESIRELGVIQPLLVRTQGDGWQVIAGRRRLAAARHAGLVTVPCVERTYDDEEAAQVTLAENLHRRRLSPIEEAIAYGHLRATGLNATEIARRVGRHQTHVSMLLRALELPDEVRDRIHHRKIGVATALDRFGRTKPHRGGNGPHKPAGADESALITHWRRRHDRIIAGIRAITTSKPGSCAEYRTLLERLLNLDLKPLDEIPERGGDWRGQFGKPKTGGSR